MPLVDVEGDDDGDEPESADITDLEAALEELMDMEGDEDDDRADDGDLDKNGEREDDPTDDIVQHETPGAEDPAEDPPDPPLWHPLDDNPYCTIELKGSTSLLDGGAM